MSRLRKLSAVVTFLLCCQACGDDSGVEGGADTLDTHGMGTDADLSNWPELPESTVIVQDHWTAEQVAAETGDGCLKEGLSALSQQGFVDFMAAGQTKGSAGLQVVWQAMADAAGNERFAIQMCQGNDCRCVDVEMLNRQPKIESVSGDDGPLPVVGSPVPAKILSTPELGSKTSLADMSAALLNPPLPEPKPEQFKGKRRWVAASSFGDVHGVSLDGIVIPAKESKRFTEVIEHLYVQAADIDRYLEDLHAQDVLLWFGPTVRAQKGAGKFKPEGMATNRGIYGDQTYDRERIETHLARAPLGGPGLIILAGAESFGTVSDGLIPYGSVENLIRSLGKRPRVVVGIRGLADANGILRSSRVLVEKLMSGAPLSDALGDATNELVSVGQNAAWDTNLSAADAALYVLSPSTGEFWGSAKPVSGKFAGQLFIGAATQCTETETGKIYHPDVATSHPLIADITVDGPFFWGQRKDEDADFFVFGVIESLRQGGSIRYWLKGSKGTVVQDLLLFADGHFCKTGECTGKVTGSNDFKPEGIEMYFTGTAESSEYRNEKSDLCKPSGMALTQGSGGPSWLVVGP